VSIISAFKFVGFSLLHRNSLCEQGLRLLARKVAKIGHHNSPPSCGCVLSSLTLLVDAATDGERNVVKNNLKLVFTPRSRLLGVVEDCPDIPY